MATEECWRAHLPAFVEAFVEPRWKVRCHRLIATGRLQDVFNAIDTDPRRCEVRPPEEIAEELAVRGVLASHCCVMRVRHEFESMSMRVDGVIGADGYPTRDFANDFMIVSIHAGRLAIVYSDFDDSLTLCSK